ncbi:MAG: beta-lactamase family protein [Clostridia bacterium]|nr:beta-lactamase family protein [Clostridia bacterium]
MQTLQQKLQSLLALHKIAGFSVAVTDRHNTIFAAGFGVESVERPEVEASARSMYRIASVTKIVTGMTILRLCEQGKLELDRPVREYLPWLSFSRPEATAQVTLRHLISHTAGLPREYTPEGPREESALEQTLREGLPSLELATLPGDGVHLYSNWGIRLASRVAEVVTGKPYTVLARELVLDPLGMKRATFDIREAITYPVSLPHEEDGEGNLRVYHRIKENAARMAAGGLYADVEELCLLARCILNAGKNDAGEQVVAPKSIAEMCRAHAVSDPETGDAYGLTMRLHNYGGRVLCGHLGSAPPYAGSLWVDPESGFGVITELNTQRDPLRFEIAEDIFSMLWSNGCLM